MLLILHSLDSALFLVLFCPFPLPQSSLPHRETIVCSNDLGLQDMAVDFERNPSGRNRIWGGNASTWAIGNLFKIMVFWATVSVVAIHLCLSFSFRKFFHTYHSYQSQTSPPRRGWQFFLKTETEQSSLSLSPPLRKIREERHGPLLPPVVAKGLFTQGTEELWSFTSSAPGEVQTQVSPQGRRALVTRWQSTTFSVLNIKTLQLPFKSNTRVVSALPRQGALRTLWYCFTLWILERWRKKSAAQTTAELKLF